MDFGNISVKIRKKFDHSISNYLTNNFSGSIFYDCSCNYSYFVKDSNSSKQMFRITVWRV